MSIQIAELVQDAEGRLRRNSRGPLTREAGTGEMGHGKGQLTLAPDAQQAVAFHPEVLAETATVEAAMG